jgi:phosphohistidine phosphatase
VQLFLVHHGEALGPDVDARQPLSPHGRTSVEKMAADAATRGVRPGVVWHSGKLRARQTAETFWKACNALAEFTATKDLQPDDPPMWMRDRLRGETRDIMIAGHFPHLPRLASMLMGVDEATLHFPPHGVLALVSTTVDGTDKWREVWRITEEPRPR